MASNNRANAITAVFRMTWWILYRMFVLVHLQIDTNTHAYIYINMYTCTQVIILGNNRCLLSFSLSFRLISMNDLRTRLFNPSLQIRYYYYYCFFSIEIKLFLLFKDQQTLHDWIDFYPRQCIDFFVINFHSFLIHTYTNIAYVKTKEKGGERERQRMLLLES